MGADALTSRVRPSPDAEPQLADGRRWARLSQSALARELIIGALLVLAGFGATLWLENSLTQRQEILENTRFVRQAAGEGGSPRAFQRLDLRNSTLSGLQLGCDTDGSADALSTAVPCADFRGARMHGSEVIGTNLSGANLAAAKLIGADLFLADLRNVTMIDADLSSADLSLAHLGGADLDGAILVDADLWSANLSDANLRGADLTGAQGASLGRAVLTASTRCPHGEWASTTPSGGYGC